MRETRRTWKLNADKDCGAVLHCELITRGTKITDELKEYFPDFTNWEIEIVIRRIDKGDT